MSVFTIKSEGDRALVRDAIGKRKLPFTVKIEKGAKRSIEQNKLQRLWVNEAADQLGDESAEDKRAYCKLHFGVPDARHMASPRSDTLGTIARASGDAP